MTASATDFQILIIDDDVEFLEKLESQLSGKGYEVATATNYEDARDILTSYAMNLVIANTEIGTRSVLELMEYMHANGMTRPTVLISENPSIKTVIPCMRLGAVDCLNKSDSLYHLTTKITGLIDGFVEKGIRVRSVSGMSRMICGYEIDGVLSEGSMGRIYKVSRPDSGDNRFYAMKVIKSGIIPAEEMNDYVERFVNEAEAASQVSHPNVVEIVDFGLSEDHQIPFMVMEFVDGRPLDQIIGNREPLTYREKTGIIMAAAKALQAMHDHHLIHRDVKPENILVDRDLKVKLIDFGVVKVPGVELTSTGYILGTPKYMAPESFFSSRVDHRADIFSLGVIAYEFFLYERAFPGDNFDQLEQQICYHTPPAPSEVDKDMPMMLDQILTTMLEKRPEYRYQSAGDLINDLNQFLDES